MTRLALNSKMTPAHHPPTHDPPPVLVVPGGIGVSYDVLATNYALLKEHGVALKGVILNKVLPLWCVLVCMCAWGRGRGGGSVEDSLCERDGGKE